MTSGGLVYALISAEAIRLNGAPPAAAINARRGVGATIDTPERTPNQCGPLWPGGLGWWDALRCGREGAMGEHESFGAWIQRRRKTLDLTQAELAERAGCALGTIRKIET